jgi:hypothetical protein
LDDFKVNTPNGERLALDVLSTADELRTRIDDKDQAEYVVRVKWLDTLPVNKAVKEVGLFGNQNTVCRPTTSKWRHTVERLKLIFKHWDDPS